MSGTPTPGLILPSPGALSTALPEYVSSSKVAIASSPAAVAIVSYRPPAASRVLDKKFFLLNGLHLGVAMSDVALTQRCLASGRCREGNPLMPSSLMGQLGMNFGFVAYSSFISYRLKKHRARLWWTSPAAGVASHSVGVAFDAEHQ